MGVATPNDSLREAAYHVRITAHVEIARAVVGKNARFTSWVGWGEKMDSATGAGCRQPRELP